MARLQLLAVTKTGRQVAAQAGFVLDRLIQLDLLVLCVAEPTHYFAELIKYASRSDQHAFAISRYFTSALACLHIRSDQHIHGFRGITGDRKELEAGEQCAMRRSGWMSTTNILP